jgi:hypothetical protein
MTAQLTTAENKPSDINNNGNNDVGTTLVLEPAVVGV